MQVNQVSPVKIKPSFGYKMNKNTVKILKDAFGDNVVDAFKKSNGNDVKFNIKESLFTYWGEVKKGNVIKKTEGFLSNDFGDFKKAIELDKINKMAKEVLFRKSKKKDFYLLFSKNK